ncbi:HAD hydrolase-like protein [Paenibacillus hubeiensis]|uniref:HAD hydrolase-like protein n=1 Tax=Paenibacillus hubeiensis TaxID=3077330 RepID=UPI0031BB7538
MKKSIIFDMDGTLFQTDKILECSLEDTFERLRSMGVWVGETPIDQYRQIMGAPLPKVWETLLPEHDQHVRAQTDVFFLERLISNIEAGKGELYPHVEEVFRGLRAQQYSIFIASNGLEKYLKTIVDHYDLTRWITEVFSIERIPSLNKSDLVGSILRKYEIEQGAVVGDRLSDIRAAKDNGLTAIGCSFDFAQEDELAQADIVINDLRELLTVLPKLYKLQKNTR